MRCIYQKGKIRLFYKASAFRQGIQITARYWNPTLVRSGELVALELADGVYYFDVCLEETGDYMWLFFENGVKSVPLVMTVVDSISNLPGMVIYRR